MKKPIYESPYKYCGGACKVFNKKRFKPDILGKKDGQIARCVKLKVKDIH